MSKTGLPSISWTANDNHLTWSLLTEMEKYENFRVLFGKVDKEEVRPSFLGANGTQMANVPYRTPLVTARFRFTNALARQCFLSSTRSMGVLLGTGSRERSIRASAVQSLNHVWA